MGFTYHRNEQDGTYTVLVDRPDWAEHYVANKFYLQDPYLRHPDVYASGVCLLGEYGSSSYKETVVNAGTQLFDLDEGLLLIEKKAASVEFFGFASKKKACDLRRVYLNQPELLHAFSTYFLGELKWLLAMQRQEAHLLPKTKWDDFYCQDPINPGVMPTLSARFLQAIGHKTLCQQAQVLSKRKRQVLTLLTKGKTYKEIACDLGLSFRKVEHYLEHAKNKLGCAMRSELIEKASLFTQYNLLD